jgi:hypothetical protein
MVVAVSGGSHLPSFTAIPNEPINFFAPKG